jgi:hypothetical protein
MAERERWMPPQSFEEDGREWFFLRFYDYEPDGLINFNVVTLFREFQGPWKQQVSSTPLRPMLHIDFVQSLQASGFKQIVCYGDMAGSVYRPMNSANLVVVARRE